MTVHDLEDAAPRRVMQARSGLEITGIRHQFLPGNTKNSVFLSELPRCTVHSEKRFEHVEVVPLTFSTATTMVRFRLEQLLKRVRPPKNRGRMRMTLTKSGVVKYDVDSFHRSKAGQNLLADSEALSRTLRSKRAAE